MDFREKWALVTGASSGLGEQFARQLAARRANLILNARSADKLEALARALRDEHGIETSVIAADLAADGGVERLTGEGYRRGHSVEHLISNAGFRISGPFIQSQPP